MASSKKAKTLAEANIHPEEFGLSFIWVGSTMFYFILSLVLRFFVYSEANEREHLPQNCQLYDEIGVQRLSFDSLEDFYPYYLCQHQLESTKLFHFLATANSLTFLSIWLFMTGEKQRGVTRMVKLIGFGILQAYALAWFSHFFFEQNKPATWIWPWLSFKSDFKLFADLLGGKFRMWK